MSSSADLSHRFEAESVGRALELVGERWTLLILREAFFGVRRFGQLVRNVHRWSAHLMVVSVTLHMIRVFYHGAYKPPREFNWVVGVLLFFVTLFLSFTAL